MLFDSIDFPWINRSTILSLFDQIRSRIDSVAYLRPMQLTIPFDDVPKIIYNQRNGSMLFRLWNIRNTI